jgi:hypothetical protein
LCDTPSVRCYRVGWVKLIPPTTFNGAVKT